MTNLSKILEEARRTKKETKRIDFKREFDPSSKTNWCELIKDIIAIANSDGGVIIFGVNDDGTHARFDKNKILEIDPATLQDKIQKYTKEDFLDITITEIKRGRKNVAVFLISPVPTPIAFTKDGVHLEIGKRKRPAFLRGTVYFRHGAKSEPGTTNDLKNAVDKIVKNVRKEWDKNSRKISRASINDEVVVSVNKKGTKEGTVSDLPKLLQLSEQGMPVTFKNNHIKELKQRYPLSYAQVIKLLKEKRSTSQKEINDYMKKCKNDQGLAISWRTISQNLEIPVNMHDKFTYSKKAVEDF